MTRRRVIPSHLTGYLGYLSDTVCEPRSPYESRPADCRGSVDGSAGNDHCLGIFDPRKAVDTAMAQSPRAPHTRLRRLVVVLTAVAMSSVVGGVAVLPASAAPPPPADHLQVEMFSNLSGVPATAGTPSVMVERGRSFDVKVTVLDATDAPVVLSNSKDTAVTLSAGGAVVGSVTVPGGQSFGWGSATVAGLANNLVLSGVATVPPGVKAVSPLQGSDPDSFDVFGSVASVSGAGLPAQNALVSAAGAGVPCEATATVTTCVDLVAPNGIVGDAFFATGVCDAQIGCPTTQDMLLVLARFGPGTSDSNPATAILKCDKVLCPGGSIQNYRPKVSLNGDDALKPAPDCAAKGVQSGPDGFCVDYVQSKRDGSGDTYLYILMGRDARPSCC